jgi:hypothetical protein
MGNPNQGMGSANPGMGNPNQGMDCTDAIRNTGAC